MRKPMTAYLDCLFTASGFPFEVARCWLLHTVTIFNSTELQNFKLRWSILSSVHRENLKIIFQCFSGVYTCPTFI